MRVLESVRRNLVARRHTTLLIALAVMFAARPLIGDVDVGAIVFSIAALFVLLAALLTIRIDDLTGERKALVAQRQRRRVIAWVLAVPAIVGRLWMFGAPSKHFLLLAVISWLLFLAYVTWSQLRSLLRQRAITGETISMSISTYLLMGLTWALLYIVIFTRHPEAFGFGTSPVLSEEHMFPIFIYFSLTTLSTIGFGDITPLTLQARYAAVAEGITGQFYLAVLVARLVGMQLSQAPPPSSPKPATLCIAYRSESDGRVVRLEGSLEAENVAELERVLSEGSGPIRLEVSALRSADARGIAVLRTLRAGGASIVGASPHVSELLNS
jgi:hypothetical protein